MAPDRPRDGFKQDAGLPPSNYRLMIKKSRASEAYSELGRLGRGPMTPEVVTAVKKALTGSTSLLVSRAADIVANRDLHDLVPLMVAAFPKFIGSDAGSSATKNPGNRREGVTLDKSCRAKTAIARALNKLEFMGDSVYLAGISIVQMEPSFGPPEDTAVELRSTCAIALARIVHPDVHFILADRLDDSEKVVRAAAAKALAYLGTPEAEMMLRVKTLCGDTQAEVMAECFTGLMTMAPGRSLEFVARYLDSRQPALVESAAIAIGNSHLPEAFATLRRAWSENPFPTFRHSLLLPIALIRSDEAFDHLIEVVRQSDVKTAVAAVGVLGLYLGDRYVEIVRQAVASRTEPEIRASLNPDSSPLSKGPGVDSRASVEGD